MCSGACPDLWGRRWTWPAWSRPPGRWDNSYAEYDADTAEGSSCGTSGDNNDDATVPPDGESIGAAVNVGPGDGAGRGARSQGPGTGK